MTTQTTKKFVITAIRYQMDGENIEEKTQKARNLVEHMPLPSQVYLKREPDNAWSRNAIAVYWKYDKMGYVSENFTADLQQAFAADPGGLLAATVTGTQGHLALSGEVENACAPDAAQGERASAARPSPFVIPMPFMEKENKKDLLAQLLFHRDFTADDADTLIEMATQYMGLAPSLCIRDCENASLLFNSLEDYRAHHGELPQEKREQLHDLKEKARTVVADIHREADMIAIFLSHLARMREAFSAPGDGFFDRYDTSYLHKPIGEAGGETIRAEAQRLTDWLDEVPQGIFHSHEWHPESIAPRMRYLHLSRREYCDITGTLLVLRRLKQELRRRQAASAEGSEEGKPVPQNLREAVGKVFTPTFTLPDKTVLNSQVQVAKAARTIDLTSNVQVAMLMKVGMESRAVRPGTSCPDFVRALMGTGALECADNAAVAKMANGMAKRINGYTAKGKRHAPLPDSHWQWSLADRPVGKRIYEAMTAAD